MIKKLLLVLLMLIPVLLSAQQWVTDGEGNYVVYYGSFVKTSAVTPEPEDDVIYLAIVGNSVAAGTYDSLLYEYPDEFKIYDMANSGDDIGDQLSTWIALEASSPATIDSFDYICLAPLGVNDVASGDSYGEIVTSFDNIISEIESVIDVCQSKYPKPECATILEKGLKDGLNK